MDWGVYPPVAYESDTGMACLDYNYLALFNMAAVLNSPVELKLTVINADAAPVDRLIQGCATDYNLFSQILS